MKKILNKDELSTRLISEKKNIQKLVSQIEKQKRITFSTTFYGQYKLTAATKSYFPEKQKEVNNWHYDFSLQILNKKGEIVPRKEIVNVLLKGINTNCNN